MSLRIKCRHETLKKKIFLPVDIALLNLLTDHDDVVMYIKALMQVERPEDNEEKFWFPTPENPGKEDGNSYIQKRILEKLRELSELEKLDPTKNEDSRTKFFLMLKWTDSLITGKGRENLEAPIVELNDIFARPRLDISMNTQFKVSPTPKDGIHEDDTGVQNKKLLSKTSTEN